MVCTDSYKQEGNAPQYMQCYTKHSFQKFHYRSTVFQTCTTVASKSQTYSNRFLKKVSCENQFGINPTKIIYNEIYRAGIYKGRLRSTNQCIIQGPQMVSFEKVILTSVWVTIQILNPSKRMPHLAPTGFSPLLGTNQVKDLASKWQRVA